MEPADEQRAVAAATSLARELGLPANEGAVLQSSNKLALHLLPCVAFVRVAPISHRHARFEIPLAQALSAAEAPTARLDPRVAPTGYERDGFEVTYWTFHASLAEPLGPSAYADGLERLHAALRTIDLAVPRFTDRVAGAETTIRDRASNLDRADRAMLLGALAEGADVVIRRGVRRLRPPRPRILHAMSHRIFTTAVADVYPHYVNKVERKGRTKAELDEVIGWLTGFDEVGLQKRLDAGTTFEDFFAEATINPNVSLITGSVCGVKVQEVEDPLMQQIRYLDKLVDELAKGRPMEKVLRS